MVDLAVEMREVYKQFPNPGGGEVAAVDNVSLQIRSGEFFSLLGPSGCGKTTSLRMIAGFEWPSQGEIFIMGQPMGHKPPHQRHVNTVFQNYALFPHMTIAQNVAFGLEMEHIEKSEINRRVGEALEMVKLAGLGARKPKQLSGGQQQRIALARALVKRPQVLLLDEPLGALDLKLRKEMQLELKQLQVQVGITFIYVTHDQEEALTMSDRIAVMSKGKVLQIGSAIEIYERPNSHFVADFIGETNLFSGEIKAIEGERGTIYIPSLNCELQGMVTPGLRSGQKAAAFIRPEKMRITEKTSQYSNSFSAHIEDIVYMGSTSRIFASTQTAKMTIWEQNKFSTLDPKAYFQPGAEVEVVVFPENILLLPPDPITTTG